jgi:predicted porin
MLNKGLLRTLLCAYLLSATTAWAAEIHGRSSTQFTWFNNLFNDEKQTEVAEYLQLGITKIDSAGKFSIYGYGRGTQDLNNGEGFNGRLYYLYGDYRDLFNKVDLRIGRQFVNIAAGSAIVDGGRVDLKNVGPVAFTLLGGRNVTFGLDGESSHEGDYVLGVTGNLVGIKHTDLEMGYFAKWGSGTDGPVRETLGASFKQYLFNSVKLYGNARYDLYGEVFNEVLAGVKYFPIPNLVLTGEWYQSYPTFDADSIFAVFAVNRYQEGVFRADYTINDKFSVNAGYSRQDYGDDGTSDVYQVGCRIRPIEPVVVNLSYDRREGYNGSFDGGIIDVSYHATKELELAAGFQYDVYQREDIITTGNEIARKYWGGAKYKLAKNMSASLRVEDDVNRQFSEDWQGRFVFNYDF